MPWRKSVRVRQETGRIYRQLAANARDVAGAVDQYIKSTIDLPQPPSRPGEPAHRKTGDMISKQDFEVIAAPASLAPSVILVQWRNSSDHAQFAEFGRNLGDKFDYAERPWFRPGMAASIGMIIQPGLLRGF